MIPGDDHTTPAFGTMYDVLRHWAQATPAHPVLLGPDAPPLTYGDLHRSIEAIGTTLNAAGLGRNDRIAVVHPGGRDMAAALLGVLSYATPVPLNPAGTTGEFALQLRDMQVRAIAISSDLESPARAAAADLGVPVLGLGPDGIGGMAIDAAPGHFGSAPHLPGPVEPDDIAAVVATSGTTSRSKIVPIRHRHLVCRNRNAARGLELDSADRCLNMLRLYQSGGLNQGLATPLIAGGSIAVLTDFSVGGIFAALDRYRPTWCTGAYTLYHAMKPHLETYRETIERVAPALRFLRSGTGPLNTAVAEEIEKTFGVPLLVTYGSSEGGSTTSDSPSNPRPDRNSVGKPLHDGVAILDEAGAALPAGTAGEIAVRGPTVFDGYENDDEANRQAFTDGWYRTGDLGYFDAEGYLFVTGRIREMINRGGQKLPPSEIDDAILSHPGVTDAAAFAIPHPTLGEDVAAAVVCKTASVPDARALSAYLRDRLAPHKIPRRFIFTDSIPKGPTGKIQRNMLADAFGLTRSRRAAAEPGDERPATALENRLQAIWASALGLAHVGLHEDFFALGGDSLQAVELFLRVEEALGRRLPRSVLFEAGTVAEMASRIEASSPSGCIVPIRPAGERPPFFAIHDVNGEVLNFRALAHHLDNGQPFYGIQSIGLDGAETPLAHIEQMAARYIAEIRKVQPAGPYFLGGYSMGGLVAYEMARQLAAQDQRIGLLALFDTYPNPKELPRSIGGLAQSTPTILRRRAFAAAWRLAEVFTHDVPKPLRRPAAANYLAVRSYRIRPYEGDAVLFKAAPYPWQSSDPHADWHALIGGKLTVHPLSRRHHEILEDPHVRSLADALSHHIRAGLTTRPPREESPHRPQAKTG